MPDLIVSSDIDTLLSSASTTSARTNLGLGSTDTVEFGGFVPPAGTTAGIDAVTTATVGQVMINSDSGQLVRFTGAATYGAITAAKSHKLDSVAASGTVTLLNSGFIESGLIRPSPNIYAPLDTLTIFTGGTSIDGQNYSSFRSYFYSDGTGGAPEAWYDISITANFDNEVIPSDSLLNFTTNSTGDKIPMRTHFEVVSEATTPTVISSEDLQAGVTYEISIKVAVGDMLKGNVSMTANYSGLFANAYSVFSVDDIGNGSRLGTFDGELLEYNLFNLATGTAYGFDSPSIGYYTLTSTVTPSTDGTFTFDIKQISSSARPLYVGKAEITVAALT